VSIHGAPLPNFNIGRDIPGPFGRTILPIDDALRFIDTEDIFWAAG
jgi:hypothetical protein